jgi:hypothetical protein
MALHSLDRHGVGSGSVLHRSIPVISMRPILALAVAIASIGLGGCDCGGPGGGPDGGPDGGPTGGTPPPQLVIAAGAGASTDGGTRLIINLGQPLAAPITVPGGRTIEPGAFPQTTVQ